MDTKELNSNLISNIIVSLFKIFIVFLLNIVQLTLKWQQGASEHVKTEYVIKVSKIHRQTSTNQNAATMFCADVGIF